MCILEFSPYSTGHVCILGFSQYSVILLFLAVLNIELLFSAVFSNLLFSTWNKFTNVLILVFSPQYSFAYHGVKRHTPPLCVLSALHTYLASLLYSRSQIKQILQFCCDSFSVL